MNKTTRVNNVVPKETLRPIQQNVLDQLSAILVQSFGPMGSNTVIKKENALNVYTKDGHTILKNIYFHGIIEQSIKDDIESITRHIVTTVGDGTTSAVIMSGLIFDAIARIGDDNDIPPVQLLKMFDKAVQKISDTIRSYKTECTVEDVYDIAMISTNGNEFISGVLRDIYAEHGMEVFIDVAAAIDENTVIKTFDGMTINTGFTDSCYVTDTAKNEAVVDNPRVYFFKDPIDTKEMAGMFDAIISKNIVGPYNAMVQGQHADMIPTVVIAPKMSRDMSSLLAKITALMNQMPAGEKLPLLIITDYHQPDEVDDIRLLCNAPSIHKYIDPEIFKQDLENGDAPTPETIQDFCGYCESVVSSSFKTSFINPCAMKDENGEFTSTYKNLLSFLETELSRARENSEDVHFIGTLKRRIHSLKSNLIELSIGGITASDRDALRDLVEDAVLNCRSAAANGVGYGANFMGLKASTNVLADFIAEHNADEKISSDTKIMTEIFSAIAGAYGEITNILYSEYNIDNRAVITKTLEADCPMNLITEEFDHKVKSSIESDIIILETINKIIGLMATCNQFIVPSPMHNVYVE